MAQKGLSAWLEYACVCARAQCNPSAAVFPTRTGSHNITLNTPPHPSQRNPPMSLRHSLPALLGIVFATTAARADDWVVYEGKDGPGKGKHIVLLSGDEEYRSEEGLPMLAKILSQRHG